MTFAGATISHSNPIDQLLARGLATKPDELALVSEDSQMSWQLLDTVSNRLARQYLSMGFTPGDRIASLMPNRPALVVHYLACIKAGFIVTPLNYRYTSKEIDYALEISRASAILYHAERDEDLAASRLGFRLPMGRIQYDSENTTERRYEDLVAEGLPAMPLSPPDLNAPVFLYFTSGSTGKPKGVTHTRNTFGNMIASMTQAIDLTSRDIFLPASSFSHVGGSLFGLTTLAAGGCLVVPSKTEGVEVLRLLRNFRPTILWMLPAALVNLVREHDVKSDDFASIRLCLSGGDKVARELEREFTEVAGFSIDENYGMTELGMVTLNPISGENRIGSIGTPSPGFEISLRNDAGDEVPVGTRGRVLVRSPTSMIGYWENPQATSETIVDGWLDTGDLMRADDDGYLWFCGRKKQIIIHDGSNICPQEVEEAIIEHPAIEMAGVIGIHDVVHGEIVRVYVTIRDGMDAPSSSELTQFARKSIGYKAPEQVVVLKNMPLNATGKVDRVALKTFAQLELDSKSDNDPK